MDDNEYSIDEYLVILRRRSFEFAIPAAAILLISISMAIFLPAVYTSTATIMIEQQDIPKDLVRSTITSYADQHIQTINQRVTTTNNLDRIIKNYGLYKDRIKTDTSEEIFDQMREDIGLEIQSADVRDPKSGRASQATIAFSLSYSSESPEMAQKIANELVSLYMNENLRSRTQIAKETTDFLANEADNLNKTISEYERNLARFKEKNVGNLPELNSLNLTLMQRTENNILDLQRQIRTLGERRIYLQTELAQIEPNAPITTSDGNIIMAPSARLKALEAEYYSKVAIYSPEHPDLIRMRSEIDQLRQVTGVTSSSVQEIRLQLTKAKSELLLAKKKYAADHPDVIKLERLVAGLEQEYSKIRNQKNRPAPLSKPDNPAYIQLNTQLQGTRQEIRSLRSQMSELKKKLTIYEDRMTQAPQVEREYKTLTRGYENALGKYKEIKNKLMEAKMAEELELGSKGERFTLLEPPLLPETPSKPNRLAIIFLGLILSIASGIGTVFTLESLDHSIRGVKKLTAVLGTSPLAVIPYIADDIDINDQKGDFLSRWRTWANSH